MKSKNLFIYIFLSSVLLLTSCDKKDKNSYQVEAKKIVVSVYASATVKSKDEFIIHSATSGIVSKVLVNDGDDITKDQSLLIIKNNNANINKEIAKQNFLTAKDNLSANSPILKELELSKNLYKSNYKEDSALYAKKKELFKKGIGSELDLSNIKVKFETSRNFYDVAKEKIEQTKIRLKNEFNNASNLYDISTNNSEDFVIKSPIDGKIYAIKKTESEFVSPQEPMVILGSAKDFILELQIEETDINKIEKDQKVYISLKSYPNKTFIGKVSKIYPILNKSTQTFTIEVAFTKQPNKLYPGLTAEANIIIQEKEKALVIPKEFLMKGNQVMLDDKPKKVKVGISNLEFVEILEGITTSDVLTKPK